MTLAHVAWMLWAEDNAIGWICTPEQIRKLYKLWMEEPTR